MEDNNIEKKRVRREKVYVENDEKENKIYKKVFKARESATYHKKKFQLNRTLYICHVLFQNVLILYLLLEL